MRSSRIAIWRFDPGSAGLGAHSPLVTCFGWPFVVRAIGVCGVKAPVGQEYQTRQPSPLSSGAPAVTHTPATARPYRCLGSLTLPGGLAGFGGFGGLTFFTWPGESFGCAFAICLIALRAALRT